MVDTYLTSFQLFGKQEREKVCIVVNGQVMDLSAPIPLNAEEGDFQSLWVYTTHLKDCGTYPPVESDGLPDEIDSNDTIGLFVMFQSGDTQFVEWGQTASNEGEIIVDFWLLW